MYHCIHLLIQVRISTIHGAKACTSLSAVDFCGNKMFVLLFSVYLHDLTFVGVGVPPALEVSLPETNQRYQLLKTNFRLHNKGCQWWCCPGGPQRGDFNIRIHIFTIYTLYFYFLETFPKIMKEKSKYKYYKFYTCFMRKKNEDILDVFLVCLGMKKADVEWTFSGTQS